MENTNNMNELEQMREQMQMLHNKIDNQEIINDDMIRRTVKSKMSWIKKYVYLQFFALPFIALVWFGIHHTFNVSLYNYAFMVIMCIIDAIWDYRINVASLKVENVAAFSLTDTLKKLTEMKQMRSKSFAIMTPLLILWFAWTLIEMRQTISTVDAPEHSVINPLYGGFAGAIIGIPVGLYAAFRIYRKMQRTNEDLIKQLNEFTDNK